MKKFTHSAAVNRELSARMQKGTTTARRKMSRENIIFITLGVFVLVAIAVNIIVNGIPTI